MLKIRLGNKMNIEEITIRQAREIIAMFGNVGIQVNRGSTAFEIGKSYFVRTATYHGTGRLIAIYPQELVFEDAAWIADSGRFSNALKTGVYLEVEPFHQDWIVSRGAIIDATELTSPLPRETK